MTAHTLAVNSNTYLVQTALILFPLVLILRSQGRVRLLQRNTLFSYI